MTRPYGADYPFRDPTRLPRKRLSVLAWLYEVALPWLVAHAFPLGLIAIVAFTAWLSFRPAEGQVPRALVVHWACWEEASLRTVLDVGPADVGRALTVAVLTGRCVVMPEDIRVPAEALEEAEPIEFHGVYLQVWRVRFAVGGREAWAIVRARPAMPEGPPPVVLPEKT